jgi:cytochrome c biogenesis protein CcmG/thiol:disulfide interchange protein DsbE
MPDKSQEKELATTESALEPSVVQKRRSRKRNITIFVVVGILNVGLLVALVMLLITPSQQASNNASSVTSNGNSAMLGKLAPNLTLSSASGTQKIPFSRYRGTPVVINFWASWCQPCQNETPFLQKNVSKMQAQGVKFISVDAGESLSVVDAFNKKYGVLYTSVIDTVTGNTAIDYGVTTFPMTFFIDRQGIIRATWNTSLNDASLKNGLSKITA